MTLVDELGRWLTDPAHWTGPDGIGPRLVEHLELSAASLVIAVAIALPLGLAIGHTGRGALAVVSVANVGRALPTLGLLGIVLTVTANWWPPYGFFLIPTITSLVALAIPPIVTNTYAGLREVDPETIEAGRGLGMRELQVLRQVEVPLAMPAILTGLRISAVQVIATATLAAVLGAGGLGRLIIDGIAQHDDAQLLVGAVLVAALAIGTELAFAWLQRRTVSPGIRTSTTVSGRTEGDVVRAAEPG